MQINKGKSSLLHSRLEDSELTSLKNNFSFPIVNLEICLNYLGFHLKPCRYFIKDWDRLVAKVEKRIKNWSFWGLSKGGNLTLVKFVL